MLVWELDYLLVLNAFAVEDKKLKEMWEQPTDWEGEEAVRASAGETR